MAPSGRRFFVGDVHGCAAELEGLIKKFGFTSSDRLYCVGDVVGKGPETAASLDLLKSLQATLVLGNHDRFLLDAATLPEKKRHTKHQAYLKSLGSNFESHLNWIRTWPLWHEEKDVLLVHAGIQPGSTDLTAMPENVLLTIRTWDGLGHDLKSPQHPPWYECASYPKPVVFGHWAANGKVDLPGFKGLDTGCVYGKELTGWCPEEDRFVSFPAAKAYCPFRV
jgi:bis(5'-nucleosyl)-tetraphosphatase (symmetrical)